MAMIETSMTVQEVSAFYKIQVSSYEDPYGLTFLSSTLTPKQKALIVSAIILMVICNLITPLNPMHSYFNQKNHFFRTTYF